MGLGRPLGEKGLEQNLTHPFADSLIAGELLEDRVVFLGHFRADRPCTKSRHGGVSGTWSSPHGKGAALQRATISLTRENKHGALQRPSAPRSAPSGGD